MAKGLKLPVGVGMTGRAEYSDGEEENRKIIFSALADCDNDNAFQQDIGLGADIVFGVADGRQRAKILIKIESIFEQFEAQHRFKLKKDTVRWTEAEGELTLEFMYLDLESDEEQSFARSFGGK